MDLQLAKQKPNFLPGNSQATHHENLSPRSRSVTNLTSLNLFGASADLSSTLDPETYNKKFNTLKTIMKPQKQWELNRKLFDSVYNGNMNDVIKALLDGADVNFTPNNSIHKTLLMLALSRKKFLIASYLIAFMSDESINAINCEGKTAFFISLKRNQLEIAQTLMPRMSLESLNAITSCGRSAAYVALSTSDFRDLACSLIELSTHEVRSSIAIPGGRTLLMSTINRRLPKIAESLIQEMPKEYISAIDNRGMTALHVALMKGYKDLAKTLIPLNSYAALNSIITELKYSGATALTLAVHKNFVDIAEILVPLMSFKAINSKDKIGRTALHEASETMSCISVVKAIRERELITFSNLNIPKNKIHFTSTSGIWKIILTIEGALKLPIEISKKICLEYIGIISPREAWDAINLYLEKENRPRIFNALSLHKFLDAEKDPKVSLCLHFW